MLCIVLGDRPHGSCKCSACKCTFWKPGLGVEKSKNTALEYLCARRICILYIMMTPLSHPLTSSLQHLNPTPSHNNNNNNNNSNCRLHACVCAAEDIEPIGVTRAKYDAPLLLHWAKKDYGQPTRHFCLLLVLFGFSFYCLFVYSAPCPPSSFYWISSATYRPGIWNEACLVVFNGSVLAQIFLKRCQERWGKKRYFWYVWTWPKSGTGYKKIYKSLNTPQS